MDYCSTTEQTRNRYPRRVRLFGFSRLNKRTDPWRDCSDTYDMRMPRINMGARDHTPRAWWQKWGY